MCGLAGKAELSRNEGVATALAPRHSEVRRDVREQVHVHTLEDAVPHEEGFRAHLLFGDARPDEEGAWDVLSLHDLLHSQGRRDIHRLSRVMALTVPGSHGEDRLAVPHARLLIGLGNAIDIRSQGDHRAARAPSRRPRAGHSRDPQLDLEAVVLQQPGQVSLGLELLKAEFAERKQLVDNFLYQLRPALDQLERLALQGLEARVRVLGGGCGDRGGRERETRKRGEGSWQKAAHLHSPCKSDLARAWKIGVRSREALKRQSSLRAGWAATSCPAT